MVEEQRKTIKKKMLEEEKRGEISKNSRKSNQGKMVKAQAKKMRESAEKTNRPPTEKNRFNNKKDSTVIYK